MTMSPALSVRGGVVALILIVVFAARSLAQTPVVSFAELSKVVKKGNVVFVQIDNGERTRGKISELSDQSIQLMTARRSGGTVTFAADRVTRVSKVDSRLNGFLIGVIAGAVPGLLFGHGMSNWCSNELGSDCWREYLYVGVPFSLVGGWIGSAIDGKIDGQTLVFRRPGVTISLKF